MKRTALVLLAFALAAAVSAQELRQLEFRDQEITDILWFLGQEGEVSVVPDETVSGRASYYFHDMAFEDALDAFLSTYKMYWHRDGDVIYVSRIRTEFDDETGLVSMDAEDVEVRLLVRALSKAIGETILYDVLPREELTVHLNAVTPEKALEVLAARFSDFEVTDQDGFYYLRRLAVQGQPGSTAPRGEGYITRVGDRYSVSVERERLRVVLDELFDEAGIEYAFLIRNAVLLEGIEYSDKSFDELLRLILLQGGGDFSIDNGIYFIVGVDTRDLQKQFKTTVTVPLAYLSAEDVQRLFPSGLASSSLYKLDSATDSIILSGSPEEIQPVLDFINLVDQPVEGKQHYRFDLHYLDAKSVQSIIPSDLGTVKPISFEGSNSFVALLAPEKEAALRRYLATVDRPPETFPVTLRYIQAATLLEKLPPSVKADDILETPDPRVILVRGTPEGRSEFMRELDVIDRPAPQIRYQLLVVQYTKQEGLNFETSYGAELSKNGDAFAFLGSLGNLLSLNFDIVAAFGYTFALNLNTDLGTNRAKVMADTTLNGLSGEKLNFRNTETSRYRDTEIDPDTGEPKATGATREISSGLIIDLEGWVSGDEMITMKVSATVSKQLSSSSSDNLPSTSEKIVSTNVRTRSGAPVTIGGLMQSDATETIDSTPILGQIPLIGRLFQKRRETVQTTEMVIYIVPHLEYDRSTAETPEERIDRIYREVVQR